jgi:cytochrome c biogenesis protein CcmG, thiol:disulfide interchange protein DsbE
MGVPPSAGPSQRRRSVLPRIGVGIAAVVVAAGLVWISTRPLVAGPATGAPRTTDGSLATGIAPGDAAPDFLDRRGNAALTDLNGRPIRVGDFAGSPVWIVFWATWCTPCQEEAADIVARYDAHRDEGLTVLAIDVQEPQTSVEQFVAAHHPAYRIALDPTAAIRDLYGGWGLPIHFFVDRNGVIRDRHIGQMTATTMEESLQTILGPPD